MRKTYEKQIEEFSLDIADEKLIQKRNPEYEKVLALPDIARRISNIYEKAYDEVFQDLEKGIKKYQRIMKSREDWEK